MASADTSTSSTADSSSQIPSAGSSKQQDGSEGAGGGDNTNQENTDKNSVSFECNICLDSAKDAVVSVCGHLFW